MTIIREEILLTPHAPDVPLCVWVDVLCAWAH